jgi:magnesium transporter
MANNFTKGAQSNPSDSQIPASKTCDAEQIRHFLNDNENAQLLDALRDVHTADLAELIEDLRFTMREKLVLQAGSIITADLLLYLNSKCKEQVLDMLHPSHFGPTIQQLSNEDIFSVIQTLNEDLQNELLSLLPKKRERLIRLFLAYPNGTIGRCMSTDFITISKNATVYQAIEAVSKNKDLPENFSEFFVVDENNVPIGVVFLKDIVNAKLETSILSYMDSDIISINVLQNTDEVMATLSKYKVMCAPVVSDNGGIVGILRSDDILDIVSEEASEGILDVGGISLNSLQKEFWSGCFMRLRWISITVVNAAFSPLVIGCFQDVLKNTIIAVLMPLVASIGGIIGIQTVSVIIKEFADGSLREKKFLHTILRESLTGMINGCIVGSALGIAVACYYGNAGLGAVLTLSIIFSMTWAAFIGSSLPIIASKLGIDSALSSGPIVTTITDVSGFAIFLILARAILP